MGAAHLVTHRRKIQAPLKTARLNGYRLQTTGYGSPVLYTTSQHDPVVCGLLITHNAGSAKYERVDLPCIFSESQRDSVPQPRVARIALPWEMVPSNDQPQRGCVLLI